MKVYGILEKADLESLSTPPSSPSRGRVYFDTLYGAIRIYDGSVWKTVGSGGSSGAKYLADTSWNGSDVTQTVDVSSAITDARNAIWALHDNANDFDRIYCSIKAISATQVTITTEIPLAAGSYRLIGLE